ncbi:hypothetical protein [Kineosporia succinea]|uniref:Suppressor of fused protein SUFU n=1 Tax=Kineosporia succinea TaxID=84632 RepID=A0ABT9PDB5_9ACTN|nr:hypothetical protein [Kineosporia succinea]MDP9830707.1 hypothetical protein [Kineosporia succinea]
MTLKPSPDTPAAAWIMEAEEDWTQVAGFGPGGFPGYVRVRFLPDPERPLQSASEVPSAANSEPEQTRRVLEVLARHTGTPATAWFCLWEGWGTQIPGFKPMVMIPNRAYYLFTGPLADAGQWDVPGSTDEDLEAALVWPEDHSWCLAKDVDHHWLGVGASEAAIQELLATPGLDVVRADPEQQQPFYL